MKEGFCNSDYLSWKKGEHGKSRSEKKPVQVVDIDRKVEEKEQQGEDNDLGTSETIAMITMVTRLIQGDFFNWASPGFAKCWTVSN